MYYNNESTSQAFALSSPLRLALDRGKKPKYANLKNVTPLKDHEDHIHFGNLTIY
jgi:hypothetical protein